MSLTMGFLLNYIVEYPLHVFLAVVVTVPVYHVFAWLRDEHGIRNIPGPIMAALSDAWLGYWAAQGCRSEHIHQMHLKYGA